MLDTLLAKNDARLAEQAQRTVANAQRPTRTPDFTSGMVLPTRGGYVNPAFAPLYEALSVAGSEGPDAVVYIDLDWLRDPEADMVTARKQVERNVLELREGKVRAPL